MGITQNKYNKILEVCLYIVIFFILHFLVLYFIFPRYYDPLWPNHNDFYVPVYLANMDGGLHYALTLPRPVGYVFFWIIGHFGISESIFAVLLLISINFALIISTIRYYYEITINMVFIVSVCCFAYLILSSPFQYTFATHDAFAQLSLFFLLMASYAYFHRKNILLTILLLMLAFFSKETFAISVLFLSFAWLVYNINKDRYRDGFIPIVMVTFVIIIAVGYNVKINSPFVTNSSDGGYSIVFSIISFGKMFCKYIFSGFNVLNFVAIAIITLILLVKTNFKLKILFCTILLPIAGIFSVLPVSLLPNHYFPGYSFNYTYFIYIPILLLSQIYYNQKLIYGKYIFIFVVILVICSPLVYLNKYKDNWWDLAQEEQQRNLIKDLSSNIDSLTLKQNNVLVTGINFPFSPFDFWESIASFNPSVNVNFYVVSCSNNITPIKFLQLKSKPVLIGFSFIQKNEAESLNVNQIWNVESNGSIIVVKN